MYSTKDAAPTHHRKGNHCWPTRCTDWRPLRKGTLRGFAEVQFWTGAIWGGIGLHQAGDRVWASPPARPMVDSNGAVLRDEKGKVRYFQIIRFANHACQRQWSELVTRTVLDAYPDAPDAEDLQ
jgi:hypothetical protein